MALLILSLFSGMPISWGATATYRPTVNTDNQVVTAFAGGTYWGNDLFAEVATSGKTQWTGYNFQNTNITKDSLINSATLTLYYHNGADFNDTGTLEPRNITVGYRYDGGPEWTYDKLVHGATTQGFSGVQTLYEVTAWDAPGNYTIDVTEVLQDLVLLPGYTAGWNIKLFTFILAEVGPGFDDTWFSYSVNGVYDVNDLHLNRPSLTVDYTPGAYYDGMSTPPAASGGVFNMTVYFEDDYGNNTATVFEYAHPATVTDTITRWQGKTDSTDIWNQMYPWAEDDQPVFHVGNVGYIIMRDDTTGTNLTSWKYYLNNGSLVHHQDLVTTLNNVIIVDTAYDNNTDTVHIIYGEGGAFDVYYFNITNVSTTFTISTPEALLDSTGNLEDWDLYLDRYTSQIWVAGFSNSQYFSCLKRALSGGAWTSNLLESGNSLWGKIAFCRSPIDNKMVLAREYQHATPSSRYITFMYLNETDLTMANSDTIRSVDITNDGYGISTELVAGETVLGTPALFYCTLTQSTDHKPWIAVTTNNFTTYSDFYRATASGYETDSIYPYIDINGTLRIMYNVRFSDPDDGLYDFRYDELDEGYANHRLGESEITRGLYGETYPYLGGGPGGGGGGGAGFNPPDINSTFSVCVQNWLISEYGTGPYTEAQIDQAIDWCQEGITPFPPANETDPYNWTQTRKTWKMWFLFLGMVCIGVPWLIFAATKNMSLLPLVIILNALGFGLLMNLGVL